MKNNNNKNTSQYIAIRQASIIFGLSEITIWMLIRNNIIPFSLNDGRVFASRYHIKLWIEKRPYDYLELKQIVDDRNQKFSLCNLFKRRIIESYKN